MGITKCNYLTLLIKGTKLEDPTSGIIRPSTVPALAFIHIFSFPGPELSSKLRKEIQEEVTATSIVDDIRFSA